jgi:hypothetical protein
MAEQINSLEELGAVAGTAAPVEVQAPREPVRDALGRAYATGKRKDAVARVWIKPGSGKVVVNGKDMAVYFARPVLQMILRQPFQVASRGRPVRSSTASPRRCSFMSRACGPRSRPPVSSPATAAWSSARNTARPRRARASSSPSADRKPACTTRSRRARSLRALFLCAGPLPG